MTIRLGMHTSLWTAAWTREAAEIAVPEAAGHGLEVLEIALLTPEKIEVEHSAALFKQYGIKPSGAPWPRTGPRCWTMACRSSVG